MLHQKVTQLALGSDFTVVVTGDGDAEHRQGDSAVSSLSSQGQSTESWASPHIVTAADLHLGEENNNKNASAKAASTFSTAGSQLRNESALLNGVEADAQEQQQEVP
ncbi:hypothetical protein Emag_003149 [Eimeria magna]